MTITTLAEFQQLSDHFKKPNNVTYATTKRGEKYQDICITLAEFMLKLTPTLKQKITAFELGECLWWDYLLISEHTQIEFSEYFQDIALRCVAIQSTLNKFPSNDWWLMMRKRWMYELGFEEDELMVFTTPKKVNYKNFHNNRRGY